jgi:hypothetical protein
MKTNFSYLVNSVLVVKFGKQYISCNGIHALCMAIPHVLVKL